MLLPNSGTLAAFEEAINPCHRLCANLAASNELLSRIRDFLIPELVIGQVDLESLGVDDVLGWAEFAASAAN